MVTPQAGAALSAEELMQSLRDTWQADDDTVAQCLASIKDADALDAINAQIAALNKVVRALSFRGRCLPSCLSYRSSPFTGTVSPFFAQLITAEDEEPQAAWLAYRTLVAELSPYLPDGGHLDAYTSPPSSTPNTPSLRSRRLGGGGGGAGGSTSVPPSAMPSFHSDGEDSSGDDDADDEEGEV